MKVWKGEKVEWRDREKRDQKEEKEEWRKGRGLKGNVG